MVSNGGSTESRGKLGHTALDSISLPETDTKMNIILWYILAAYAIVIVAVVIAAYYVYKHTDWDNMGSDVPPDTINEWKKKAKGWT